MLAQVPRHGEHRLGGPQGVVESAQCDLGPEAPLRARQRLAHLLHVGEQREEPVFLQLQEDLPVGVIEPGRPVRLAQRRPAVFLQILRGQLLERHRQQRLAAL